MCNICVKFSPIGDVVLRSEHFIQVREFLWNARSNYQNLGYCLGVSPESVRAVQESNHYIVDKCFDEILKELLKPGLSRNRLAEALASGTMRYGHLAQRVRIANFVCKFLYDNATWFQGSSTRSSHQIINCVLYASTYLHDQLLCRNDMAYCIVTTN